MAGPSPSHVARGHGWWYDHCRPTHDRATRGGAPNVQLISSCACPDDFVGVNGQLKKCALLIAMLCAFGREVDNFDCVSERLGRYLRNVIDISKLQREIGW
ncbi:hypothetical protein E4J93_03260 [Collinsella sp. BA40]|nr:hypothetical protein E4J93_03260 [Collinsella sp. BA40]